VCLLSCLFLNAWIGCEKVLWVGGGNKYEVE
jgi:hypothetical protein